MRAFKINHKMWALAVLILIISAAGLSRSLSKNSGGFMIMSSDRVGRMFEKTHLSCFGRFIITVPEGAVAVYGPAQVDGTINRYRNQAFNLDKIISLRLLEVEEEKANLPKYQISELPMIGAVIDGARLGQKIAFGADDSNGYTLHSYLPIGKDLFVLEMGRVSPKIDKIPELKRFAEKFHSRGDGEIPVGPGICVDGGFINFEPEYENNSFGLHFRDFPDVRFSISTKKNGDYLQVSDSLKLLRERAAERAGALGLASFFSGIKMLRDGRRQLDGWEGEEILTRRPAYKDDTDAHEFRFLGLGLRNDALHPLLDIRLDSGVKDDAKASISPSLTDEEALALWDRLLPSIRVRQPTDATLLNDSNPKAPLGTISKSGEKCPQTGIWECTDKRRIGGERRRLFKEGEKIPPVIATGHISFWRTLIGDVYRVAYVDWKLVAYESTPPDGAAEVGGNPAQDNPAEDNHA